MYSLGSYLFLSFFVGTFMTVVCVVITKQMPKAFRRVLDRWPIVSLFWNLIFSGLISLIMGQSSMAGFANILSSVMFVAYWNYMSTDKAPVTAGLFNKFKKKWGKFQDQWDEWNIEEDDVQDIRDQRIKKLEEELKKLRKSG